MDEDFYICGLFADQDGGVNLTLRSKSGATIFKKVDFEPFLWASEGADELLCSRAERLKNEHNCILDRLLFFNTPSQYNDYLKKRDKSLAIEKVASLENQYLMQTGLRMFKNAQFSDLVRMQLDIETSSEFGFPNPDRAGDRVIAVGVRCNGKDTLLEIEDFTDEAEKKLLVDLQNLIISCDPDTIEGHNIFRFDLDFIRRRMKRLKLKMQWGRFGKECAFRSSRIKIAERQFDYPRCDIAGRTVVDTLLLLQLYDISARELSSYSLKAAALHFGFSKEDERTYIKGDEIQNFFVSDRETFRKYLLDDIRETYELANRLLPTYVAQVGNFPLTLQECLLRGTGVKVEYIFLEKYYHARAALPEIKEAQNFVSGGFSESFKSGVFKNVLHYDVASLYPSLMLHLNKCPQNDYLNVFLDVLKELRAYRLEYKKRAKESQNIDEKNEFNARQASFKILINSFYGYLGLATARFGDSKLADEITTLGRTLLVGMIENFKAQNCEVLEADTDGIYVSCGNYFNCPTDLVSKVASHLPKGVELEFDGAYKAMFCYKAKNYALLEDDGVRLKGSALRSRALEKYLRDLTTKLINILLGVSDSKIEDEISSLKTRIENGEMSIEALAKSEHISLSPEVYLKSVESTGKGRRASLEAALKSSQNLKSGDKVSYFISNVDSSKGADWKRAYPIELYNPKTLPYDPSYYLKKLEDWQEKFSEFLPKNLGEKTPIQGELFDF